MIKIKVLKENEYSVQFEIAEEDVALPVTGDYYLLSEHEKADIDQKLLLAKQIMEKIKKVKIS